MVGLIDRSIKDQKFAWYHQNFVFDQLHYNIIFRLPLEDKYIIYMAITYNNETVVWLFD